MSENERRFRSGSQLPVKDFAMVNNKNNDRVWRLETSQAPATQLYGGRSRVTQTRVTRPLLARTPQPPTHFRNESNLIPSDKTTAPHTRSSSLLQVLTALLFGSHIYIIHTFRDDLVYDGFVIN